MIIVNRKDNSLVQQVSSSLSPISMNGRYFPDEPDFVKSTLSPSSTVSSLRTDIANDILDTYSTYRGIIYNPLLDNTDISKIDTNYGFFSLGESLPNSVKGYPKGGTFGIHTINLTIPSGTDKIMVYWRSATISYSYDKSPLPSQPNSPIVQQYDLSGTDEFTVYAIGTPESIYRTANKLESISFSVPQTDIRLAFVNNSSKNIHLLAYAILYV